MKSLSLSALVSSVAFLFSGAALANDAIYNSAYQNVAKRPYLQVSPSDKSESTDQWEGATLLANNQAGQLGVQKTVAIRTINLNMLSKHPYMY